MATSLTAFGSLKNGHIFLDDRAAYLSGLLKFKDGPVCVRVEAARSRTDAQNKFWHAVVVEAFADHCGEDHDEMHEVLKAEVNSKTHAIYDRNTGEFIKEVVVAQSTANLTTVEFNELIERAQRLGASMGIVIPDPDPHWKDVVQ